MAATRSNPFWLVAVIGFGVLGYGLFQWFSVDELSESELQASVEANYQVDVTRMRARSPDGSVGLGAEWERKHKQAIREELQGQTRQEKDFAQSWIIAGMGILIFSLGRIFAARIGRAQEG
jgi:hypothetical protein